ncbi:MAG TPA: glutamate 5-kinase [Gammaproteobacteria bacterium]|nr:glutamate 5-kinase [Gammaproteobacteria bacterium]
MSHREKIPAMRRWVVKIGSSLLTNDGKGLDLAAIAAWTDQMAQLKKEGVQIVLVSSGAVAEGLVRLGWDKRPHAIHELQAAAAVGQMGLVQTYESQFQKHDMHTAQVLLTHDDLSDRKRYLNARSTLRTLLDLSVVPVVNENDTVATDEIRFGDNDTLAALVANLIEADLLVILTDQDGLYDADPRANADAKLIREGLAGDVSLQQVAGDSPGEFGRGGMSTKVQAATRAARSGTITLIASGRVEQVLVRLQVGEELGSLIYPNEQPMSARKQWLASQLMVKGKLVLDEGAVNVLCQRGKSLLPIGVTVVEGDFSRGELVACLNKQGKEIARGLTNYSSAETRLIKGQSSDQIETILGYLDESVLIHRDDLVLM